MPPRHNVVSISLGWVVLDRPDQSGRYIAKDLAGGWAYLITDADGDTSHRGQGPCAGGPDVALAYAFLSALGCVPYAAQIRILVDTRQAHRVMVNLARNDSRVAAAIAGRQVAVMTRPLERHAGLVQVAAERAASQALRDRERAEWHDIPIAAETTTEIAGRPALLTWRDRQAPEAAAPTPPATRRNPLGEWLRDLNGRVKSLNTDLEDAKF